MSTTLQNRLKGAGRLLPFALLPFAAQAQSLNYTPANASYVAGTYADQGTAGTAIAVANTDDANSTAQPIGFTFNFNGQPFTQFVLNTNGFLKLGATAPSAAAMFLPESTTASNVDPFQSADPADVNIIAPFNTDLTAGNGIGTEYRVATTGTGPNRVCTIQWKNVSDKAATTATQYANFSFQVKLYESSGNIEFVYDAPTISTAAASVRYTQAGLKGSGFNDGQFVQASKSSGTDWNAATFANAITNNTLNTLNFRNNVLPTAGATYRFTPTVSLANDAAVTALYALGKASSSFGSPVTARAVITNTGTTTRTNLAVTLAVTGATTYTNTQSVASLAPGASTTVTFTYPIAGTTGTNNLTVSIPADDQASNNSQTFTQTISAATLSYQSGTAVNGGAGVAAAGSVIAVGYRTAGAAAVTAVTPAFAGTASAPAATYQVLIYSAAANGQPGTVLYTSPTRPRPAGTTTSITTETVAIPNIAVNGAFFVGLKSIGADNLSIAYQTEIPLRGDTFFFTTTNGTSWTDINTSTLNSRLLVDVTFGVVTATRNAELSAAVTVSPNPARQRFTLGVPAGSLRAASATLANALGQVVATRQLSLPAASGTTDFDVSRLAAGIYTLTLQSGNDLVVKRVVVE